MIKTSLILLFAYLCQGCASSQKIAPVSKTASTMNPPKRLVKYAQNQGCQMLRSGYMVCPKSHNR